MVAMTEALLRASDPRGKAVNGAGLGMRIQGNIVVVFPQAGQEFQGTDGPGFDEIFLVDWLR